MKRNKKILISSLVAVLSLGVVLCGVNKEIDFSADANDKTYQILLNPDKNKFDLSSSSSYVQTELGNNVGFTYSGVSASSNYIWHILNGNGYFYNSDPIHGLKSISVNIDAASTYRIYYSVTGEDFVDYAQFTGSKQFNFNDAMPNYFKIVNIGSTDINIEYITLSYSCTNEYHSLSVVSTDESKGTVSLSGGLCKSGTDITLTATAKEYYMFDSWSNGDSIVSKDNPYTFTMPNHDYELKATFVFDQEEWDIAHGVKPTLSDDGKTIEYGLYPQTVVVDETLINTLNTLGSLSYDENTGWYKYKNEYYCCLNAAPYVSGYTFDNGTTIVSGTKYWFKCETITWNILSNNSGTYYLLSEKILDAHCYFVNTSTRTIDKKTVYSTNYMYSDLRAWLNGYDASGYGGHNYSESVLYRSFAGTAFNLGSSYIETTTVDNSAATTSSSSNSYACDNTEDKIFLPSYQDYLKAEYGFPTSKGTSTIRQCKPTDYAKANGAFIETSNNLYTGRYWTRSPMSSNSRGAATVNEQGDLELGYDVNDAYISVRPSITLKFA